MDLRFLDPSDAEKIVNHITKTFGLEIDEFDPVDEATFAELSTRISNEVDADTHQAFLRCFEHDHRDGYYFLTTGRDSFLENLDEECEV